MTMLEPAINAEAQIDMPFLAEKTMRRLPVKVEPRTHEPVYNQTGS